MYYGFVTEEIQRNAIFHMFSEELHHYHLLLIKTSAKTQNILNFSWRKLHFSWEKKMGRLKDFQIWWPVGWRGGWEIRIFYQNMCRCSFFTHKINCLKITGKYFVNSAPRWYLKLTRWTVCLTKVYEKKHNSFQIIYW